MLILLLFFCGFAQNLLSMDKQEMIMLHTGSLVPKKLYNETWPKLEKLGTEGHLKTGAQYALYAFCHRSTPELKTNVSILESLGFPTKPELYTDDLKKIILATNSLSLSAEKRRELGHEYNLDFINPADPLVGFIEDAWD